MKKTLLTALLTALAAALMACTAAPAATSPPPSPSPEPLPSPTPTPESVRLPAPTGPYAVGHRQFPLVDGAREELHTPEADDQREMVLHVWYPAEPAPGTPPGLYLAPPLAEAFGLSDEANAALAHALPDAPPADTGDVLPVVIFNNGFNTTPAVYTALLEDLASHGYVVAAANHPYVDTFALLPDGEVVAYPGDADFVQDWNRGNPYEAETYLMWIPDTIYVIQELGRLNDDVFGGRLALDQMGFMGHSFGGGVSAETCRILAERCAGAINLDGSHPARLVEVGMPAPYLYMAAEMTGSAESPEVRDVYEGAGADAYIAEFAGATHMAFSDGFYLRSAQGDLDDLDRRRYGAIEPDRMAELTRRYALAFFDRYLRGEDAPALAALAEADEEITIEARQAGE